MQQKGRKNVVYIEVFLGFLLSLRSSSATHSITLIKSLFLGHRTAAALFCRSPKYFVRPLIVVGVALDVLVWRIRISPFTIAGRQL
jgi:hypothetical protein